jgi:hypothetical protein
LQNEQAAAMVMSSVRFATGVALLLLTLPAFRAVAGIAPPPLTAADGDTYDLYAGADALYDDNFYRLPTNYGSLAGISPKATRADSVYSISAGGDGQWALGRQVFNVSLHADENRFVHNDSLNNTGGYAKLLWNWQIGSYFSGTAGATYSHALVSFGEALFIGRDLLTSTDYFGTARYQVGPHWAVYGGVNDSSISHSEVQARSGDFKTQAGTAGVEYAADLLDTYSFEYRYDDGRFRTGQVFTFNGVNVSPDFHDDTLLLTVHHSFSEKTQLIADAGYLKRFYPNTTIGSFAGDVWRATVNWQPSEKTQLAFAVWRELHAYLVSESNYFVSRGESITPSWQPTEKLSLSAALLYESQNYIPDSASAIAFGSLSSKIIREQLNFGYSPRDRWRLGLTFTHTNRESNNQSFRYLDNLVDFNVLYQTR